MPQKLINLNPQDYEHPFDKEALAKVNAIPLLPTAMNFMLNWTVIRWNIITLCGNNFHVTSRSCPKLFEQAKNVWETLDLETYPDLYVHQDYYINAYTTGDRNDAFMVLSSGASEKLSDEELSFVIGHESGHIKSRHVLYHILCAYISQIVTKIPGASIAATPLTLALSYWNRMSEFTADRAGLLACQDLHVALSSIMKMSGLPEKYYNNASVDDFVNQAKELKNRYNGIAENFIKLIEICDEDHPWTVVRAAELVNWVDSGQYQAILDKTKGKKCPECKTFVASDTRICPICGFEFKDE